MKDIGPQFLQLRQQLSGWPEDVDAGVAMQTGGREDSPHGLAVSGIGFANDADRHPTIRSPQTNGPPGPEAKQVKQALFGPGPADDQRRSARAAGSPAYQSLGVESTGDDLSVRKTAYGILLGDRYQREECSSGKGRAWVLTVSTLNIRSDVDFVNIGTHVRV